MSIFIGADHRGYKLKEELLSPAQVSAARNDDDINILSIAADYTDINSAKDMVTVFLAAPFSGADRHRRRLEKITGFAHLDV